MKEVKLGRYAGPFYEDFPYQYFVQSPLGLVPKSGGRTRLIFHLSYDFGDKWEEKSINYHIPEEVSRVKYKDLDHALKVCLTLRQEKFEQLKKRFAQLRDLGIFVDCNNTEDEGIFLAKTDIEAAFRLVPVCPDQRCLLTMACKHLVSGETAYFIEKNLSFGLSKCCAIFQLFSDALCHIIEALTGCHFLVTNFLDDFFVH